MENVKNREGEDPSVGFPRSTKRMIAHQIERELFAQNISRTALADRMGTSRAAVNRLLDPTNDSVTLQTLERVSLILGKQLQVFLKDVAGECI
ncbi:helix-turn-helix domain-containing protein [bacterium]|nr:helix-turn-helix domain-containing protein [bacterium]